MKWYGVVWSGMDGMVPYHTITYYTIPVLSLLCFPLCSSHCFPLPFFFTPVRGGAPAAISPDPSRVVVQFAGGSALVLLYSGVDTWTARWTADGSLAAVLTCGLRLRVFGSVLVCGRRPFLAPVLVPTVQRGPRLVSGRPRQRPRGALGSGACGSGTAASWTAAFEVLPNATLQATVKQVFDDPILFATNPSLTPPARPSFAASISLRLPIFFEGVLCQPYG